MWRVLEIGEKIEVGDERYWPKDMAWSTVTESCIGSQVVRTDHVVRRKISDNAESSKPTHETVLAFGPNDFMCFTGYCGNCGKAINMKIEVA